MRGASDNAALITPFTSSLSSGASVARLQMAELRSDYFAEIGMTVVTGFVCVGLFSSPPEASAPCDELLTTAMAGMPIPTTESVCILLVISPEAKPSREAMP